MFVMHWTYPLVLLAMTIAASGASYDPSMTEILVDRLFESYKKNVRPGAFHTNITTVNIGFAPTYVKALDEEKSLFSIEGQIRLDWIDNRLSWDPSDYMGIEVIRTSNSFPWLPDISVYNSPSKHWDPKMNTNVLIYSTGKVVWIPPSNIVSFCPLKMSLGYPKDLQACAITLGSWSYDGWHIDLVVKKETYYLDDFINTNPQWEVLLDKSKMFKVVKQYSCCKEPYVTVVARFTMKRRITADQEMVKAPCILVLVLTLLTFWISPRSEQKIVAGAFLLLMLTILLVYVASSMKFSHGREKAASFIRSSMYIVTSAVALQIILINLIRCLKYSEPPKFVRDVLSNRMLKFISNSFPRKPSNSAEQKPEETKPANDHLEENGNVEKFTPKPQTVEPFEEWNMMAFLIEKILFGIYVIAIVSVTV